ncbi:malate dehydrogenase, cytoplasmic [Galendromus occidentalis]|uniref:Malate dehydrogenase n=1 Tax=Galendromus occidentalis TaxID=34638 RepID=A0AAJ6VZH0_9ACAR|nr:malate dehydrogenase, cytoplasmic [Galendromus occidentalis]
MASPVRVVITGAAGQIGYSLVQMVCRGDVFGPTTGVIVHLLDIPPMLEALGGLVMELEDCAFPLLKGVVATADVQQAFSDVDAAFLVGAMPRREGMERKDLLSANVKIFKAQGQALDQYAKKSVKILVVGNPANTNAAICSKYAPSIPKENFTAMTRLDQNRACAQIAKRLNKSAEQVKNVIIWGNHSSTQFPDASAGIICDDSSCQKVVDAIKDEAYLNGDFITTVQKRGQAVIQARKLSSAMSAAKAACDHMRDWWFGTKAGEFVSMGVISDGSYGAAKDVIFSFPVEIKDGQWKIHQGLSLTPFAQEKIKITSDELVEEKEAALTVCQD